jgi:hypothetical protein
MEPIYQTSIMGLKITVFPERIVYKKGYFGKEINIPAKQIASVVSGITGKVTIETAGGKKYKLPVKFTEKTNLQNAITSVMA